MPILRTCSQYEAKSEVQHIKYFLIPIFSCVIIFERKSWSVGNKGHRCDSGAAKGHYRYVIPGISHLLITDHHFGHSWLSSLTFLYGCSRACRDHELQFTLVAFSVAPSEHSKGVELNSCIYCSSHRFHGLCWQWQRQNMITGWLFYLI
jgi:hypothetical protein